MRKLQTKDCFGLMKILKKMGMKDEMKELIVKSNKKGKKDSVENVQAELVMLFIENIGNAEEEIYKFLGKMTDKTPEEIATQPPIDTINQIKELVRQENFESFLSNALK